MRWEARAGVRVSFFAKRYLSEKSSVNGLSETGERARTTETTCRTEFGERAAGCKSRLYCESRVRWVITKIRRTSAGSAAIRFAFFPGPRRQRREFGLDHPFDAGPEQEGFDDEPDFEREDEEGHADE